ncbi:MAG: serine/threonine-protein kinase, partial [Bradymonadaceae bacterium]
MSVDSSIITLGPFELHSPIGKGGMGEVWQGTHRAQGVEVAIKVMTAQKAREARFSEAFRHEVRSVARLSHPGIVRVFEHGTIPGQTALASQGLLMPGSPYLVMELAMGTLEEIEPAALDWEQQRTILIGLLDALAHAHARGVIHRDIKPANVLIVPEPSGPRLKLSDFGLARPRENHPSEEENPSPERVTGTPRYMAPEQILGRWRDQGPWTDLYALGCLAYWLASGDPPFCGDDTDEILRGHLEVELPILKSRAPVPKGYSEWLAKVLSKGPRSRYRYAADAAHDLMKLGEFEGRTHDLRIVHRRAQHDPDRDPTLDHDVDITDLITERIALPDWVRGHKGQVGSVMMGSPGSAPPMPSDWRSEK